MYIYETLFCVPLSFTERAILYTILKHGPITSTDLCDAIPIGRKQLRVHITRIRHALAPYGYRIPQNPGGWHNTTRRVAVYYVERTPQCSHMHNTGTTSPAQPSPAAKASQPS